MNFDKIFRRGLIEKNKIKILWVAAFLFFLSLVLFSNYGIIKRFALEGRKNELYKDLRANKKIIDSLNQRIDVLESDSTEMERLAREEYGMIKPGEKVFIIRKKK
jgi:cell division protein FtsB